MSLQSFQSWLEYAVVLIFGALVCSAWGQPLVSSFDSSIEGWTVETHSSPAESFSFIEEFFPDFVPAGGHPGGHISELDPDSNWSFFRAPVSWSGDRSLFSNGWIHYSTRTDSNSFPDGRLVILIGNNGQAISTDAGIPDLNTWTRRRIGLNSQSNEWLEGTNADGVIASGVVIDGILADLEAVYIGLEFGGDVAEEMVGLDSVRISDCRADLNGDGLLNFFDISLFISDRVNYDPDPLFNFFDISLFLSDFSEGCP